MNEFLLYLNFIYLAVALIQLLVTPRIGPNPYLGFRIGYTFSSRRTWVKVNRLSGGLMTLHALALMPLAHIFENEIGYYIAALIVPLILISVWGTFYAAHMLEEERVEAGRPVKPLTPLETSFVWKYLGVILFSILLVSMAVAYPSLPQRIAVHFDASGNPDGWNTKKDFYLTYTLFGAVYLLIIYLFVFIGKRYPAALHSGIMKIGRDTVFKAAILSLNVVYLLLLAVFVIIYLYNVGLQKGQLGITYLLVLATFAAFTPVGYIIYRWKKEKKVMKNE